ncbi:MAG TPA: glycosyl transferase [bacterium]|nr:glycosyl transferase [bacterium]
MTDFFQNGVIATLQRIGERPVAEIEAELRDFSSQRSVILLLPALYSEFEGPAMPRIIEELRSVPYLKKIVLSLDRADEEQFRRVKGIMRGLPAECRVLWQDSPDIKAIYDELDAAGFNVRVPGKGRSVWLTLGYILADHETESCAIALHDCDIVNYSRELLARLVYPIVHPALNFEFSKGYYARATDRLYGRVTRIFYTPLLRSLTKILGNRPFLDFLDSFRYPLSGEFACIGELARSLRISPTWGLEVSMLSEVYQQTNVNRVCQVEILDTYEHKHRELSKDDPSTGLSRMAEDIAQTLFRVLSQDGYVMSDSFFRTLLSTYIQESRKAIEKYNGLASLNGLAYDRNAEIGATEVFVNSMKRAQEEFARDPIGIPLMSAWVRVTAAKPDLQDRLFALVEAHNR